MTMKLSEVQALSAEERSAMADLKESKAQAIEEILSRQSKGSRPADLMRLTLAMYEAREDAKLLRGVKDDDLAALRAEVESLKAALAVSVREAAQLEVERDAYLATLKGMS